MRAILVVLLSFIAAALPSFGQGSVTPIGHLKVTSSLDVSGISNKSTVRSDLGVSDAGNLSAGTLANARLSSDVLLDTGSYANPSWLTSLAWSKLSGKPTTLSGFGISDPLILLTSGSYANPTWLTSLAWSKITGRPTNLSGYGIVDAQPLNSYLTTLSTSGSALGLSLAQKADAASMRSLLSAPQQVTYVVDGDSRTFGTGSPAISWFDLLAANPANTILAKNYGISGKTVDQMSAGYAGTGAASLSVSGGHQWSPAVTGNKGIYFLWGATNDLGGGASASAVLANLQALYALAHADGYSKVVAFTETPRAPAPGAGWETTSETQRLALNASLRGLTLGQSNTPDVLIDTDRLFPTYATFPDGIHITAAQEAILASYVRAILAGDPPSYQPFVALRWIDGSATFHAGGAVQMTGFSVQADSAGLYNSTTHTILCPTAGWVCISLNFLRTVVNAGDVWELSVYDTPAGGSAAEASRLFWWTDATGSGTYLTVNAGTYLQVAAGDTLDFRIDASGGTHNNWTILANTGFSNFTVRYVPAP